MTEEKLPTWFWVVAVLAVLWNLLGCFNYYMNVTMTPEAIAQLPQVQQDLLAAMPGWITGLFAIAVFVGLAGGIALCLKKKIATPLFAISLAAAVVQMIYVSFVMDAVTLMGASSLILPSVIILLGALELWFSMHTTKRGWLT